MTKANYDLIAGVIKSRVENTTALNNFFPDWTQRDVEIGLTILEELASYLAVELEENDPKFDRNKFLQACGIETGITEPEDWTRDDFNSMGPVQD